MFRVILLGAIFFLLPHSDVIPIRVFGIRRGDFPFGIMNIIFLMAIFLWFIGKVESNKSKNPFRVYSAFVVVVGAGILVALFTGFEADPMEVLKVGKEEVALLLLYFLPLAVIRNKEDFTKIFIIILLVHVLIGLETMRSGVLSGSAFHDGKRGSGPFGWSYRGSDVAGAYLAQVIMFFLAVILMRGTKIFHKGAAGIGAFIIFYGIIATYSRGSLLGVIGGLLAMLFVQGLKVRNIF